MKIELKEISVRDLVAGYINNNEDGVIGYSGRLDIRPKYQREFVYKDRQRDAVIDTVRKGFPLNVMYWSVGAENHYEVLDGQQRTISLCEYVTGKFSLNFQFFHNLEKEEQTQILDYTLMVYFCEGTDREKLDWFKTINIAGEKLTDQELRNAVYTGPWLTDAKRYFSKPGCAAHDIGSAYLSGSAIRQDYLETVLDWISEHAIEQYMAINQHESSAYEIWMYFQNVINWVKTTFPTYRKEMKGVDFGTLYNRYRAKRADPLVLEARIGRLMLDEDVTKKSGIYTYVLTDDPRALSIRAFNDRQRREAYERQRGLCVKCGHHFALEDMQADHITPWVGGGKTVAANCQMLCKRDNQIKSDV